jgi:Protein of unknown function (DUF3237)
MFRKVAFLFTCLLIQNEIYAQNFDKLDLEFVCELKVTTDKSMSIGTTSHGERRIIPITGGTFEGPKLNGIVLNGGADYQFANIENTRTEIEAIYTIKTDDGVLIHIRNVGLSIKSPENIEKLAKGEPMDLSKNYFRAAPKFEAPNDSKYSWLNDAIFVCRGIPTGKGYVIIQVWKVL